MGFTKVNAATLVLLMMGSAGARAEGSAEAAAHGGGEATQERAPQPDAGERRRREYQEKTQRLNFLKGGLEANEKELSQLTRQKDSERNPAQLKIIMEQMLTVAKARDRKAAEIMALTNELKLRFPEAGDPKARLFRTAEPAPKSKNESQESASGLDELLTRTKRLIDRKYAPLHAEKAASSHPTVELSPRTDSASAEPIAPPAPKKRLRLER